MSPDRVFTSLMLSISVYFILAIPSWGKPPSPGGPDSDATFTVAFLDGTSVVAGGNDVIGVQPNQAVTVVAQYVLGSVGRRITAVPLDGGRILGTAKQLIVDANGTVQFQFQAGWDPGTYQISLRDGTQEIAITFWVLDSGAPGNNPPVINN